MNRWLLSHDPAVLPPDLLTQIQSRRVHGRSVRPQAVRLTTRGGARYDLPLLADAAPLPDGVSVYVWWAASGLVCAPVTEVDAAEAHSAGVDDQVRQARESLARARLSRAQRHAERPADSGPMPLPPVEAIPLTIGSVDLIL